MNNEFISIISRLTILGKYLKQERKSPKDFNLCRELKCPFAKGNGCSRFTSSFHCPVALNENAPGYNSEVKPNGYWLWAAETADIEINHLRKILHEKVLDDPMSLAHGLAQSDKWDEIQGLNIGDSDLRGSSHE